MPPSGWWGQLTEQGLTSLRTATPYSNNAGITSALAATPSTDGAYDISTSPIAITGATVIATFENATFGTSESIWIRDGFGAIRTYMVDPGRQLYPGDRVNLSVTELTRYNGGVEITGGTVTFVSANNGVFIEDLTGTAVSYQNNELEVVRLYGELVASQGLCGGNRTCWDFQHGGQTVTLRTSGDSGWNQASLAVGDCVEIVSPVYVFGTTTQIDASLRDSWVRTY
ncbi:MAG: hypothetical protein EP330_31030 [Deltaproteobacteria bacterium]|nr:MAG: hypothetical protein EP330_31030 [Deltaproteobacteria bacterium]